MEIETLEATLDEKELSLGEEVLEEVKCEWLQKLDSERLVKRVKLKVFCDTEKQADVRLILNEGDQVRSFKYHLEHLPPVSLEAILPDSYPSH